MQIQFTNSMCNSNRKWNNKKCQCEYKNYCKCEKDYIWNLSTCICENNKYLKRAADTSVTEVDEIAVMTKKGKCYSKHETASLNCHSKKVIAFYILHTVY